MAGWRTKEGGPALRASMFIRGLLLALALPHIALRTEGRGRARVDKGKGTKG